MSGTHTHALTVHGHSPVHRLAPQVKVAALVAYVGGVVATPHDELWAFAVHAFLLFSVVAYAELPFGFVLRRMLIEVPFVAFAFLLPFLGSAPKTEVGGLLLSIEGLWGAWNIVVKGTLGVGASVVLVATTEIPELLRGMERLRVPKLLISIAGFMVRYLEVILGELGRTRTAMVARGHDPRWIWQIRPLALSAGALFVRSYERGERVYQAMLARGYDGRMPSLSEQQAPLWHWATGLALPVTGWLVAALAVIG